MLQKNQEFETTKNNLLLEIQFLKKINQISNEEKKDKTAACASNPAGQPSTTNKPGTTYRLADAGEKDREKMNSLERENTDLRKKLSLATAGAMEGNDPHFDTSRFMTLNRFTHDHFDGYNIPELMRICRVIIARRGVFTLNMMELATVYKAIYTAALEKDPHRKMAGTISFDLCSQKDRIQHLENELVESKKILKVLSKQRGEFNIFIDTKAKCTQLAKERNVKRKT